MERILLFTTNHCKKQGKNIERIRDGKREVIDGQQRPTSIQILLSYVSPILKILKATFRDKV